jgi:hypothetical protein
MKPKSGFIADGQAHAVKTESIWLFGYCGKKTPRQGAYRLPVFRVTGQHPLCGACVCEIENEGRRVRG